MTDNSRRVPQLFLWSNETDVPEPNCDGGGSTRSRSVLDRFDAFDASRRASRAGRRKRALPVTLTVMTGNIPSQTRSICVKSRERRCFAGSPSKLSWS